jgi:hypothetical protein
MKVRLGFVSNSSSSSFIALMRKQDYNTVISNLSPLAAAVAKHLSGNVKFCGQDHVRIAYISGNYSWDEWTDRKEIEKDAEAIARARGISFTWDDNEYYDATSDIDDELGKLGNNVFTHSEDF